MSETLEINEIEPKPGQRILISEVHGQVFHTFRRAENGRVYTDEVPGGFSSVFVVGVKPSEGPVIPF